MSAAAAKEPDVDLEDLLEDLGFMKGGGANGVVDEEAESIDTDGLFGSSGSSASFSFQLETQSSSVNGSLANFGGNAAPKSKAAMLDAILSRFGCTLFHRCWAPDENTKEGTSSDDDGDPGAGGDDAEADRARHRAARRKRNAKQDKNSADRAREEHAILKEMRPWRGEACIMFIDLSGYSTIASYLTARGGAHALSSAVNAYFETILSLAVGQYRGDVLTFAGDAIVVAWPVLPVERSAMEAVLAACACAMDLQRKCGMSPVAGTDLAFRMHIGISFGDIQVEILTSYAGAHHSSSSGSSSSGGTSSNMQRAYPFVSGRPLAETASVVDTAKIGEVCITKATYLIAKQYLQTTERKFEGSSVYLLTTLDDDHTEALSIVSLNSAPPNQPWITQNIVAPSVGRKLRQGFKAAHIAEMRSLCVLFLKKAVSESVATEEWFSEVHGILEKNRCPIVQMLHDDKGTHIIAAVNLYRTERVPATVGLLAARAIVDAECGVQLGMATGEVFCGITGGDLAARWDITGPAVVRAARLMQHAEKLGVPVVCDESVYESCDDNSQLSAFPGGSITLKGSKNPVKIYRLSSSSIQVTSAIRNTSWINPMVHGEERNKFANKFLISGYDRGVAVVSGPIGCGKQTLIDSTAQTLGYTTMVHPLSRDPQPLSALTTFAAWFSHHRNKEISKIATDMVRALESGRKQTRSLALGHQLIDLLIKHGLRVCLVIAYAQFLDAPSLSFFRSIATPLGEGWSEKWIPKAGEDLGKRGKFRVCFTTYPLHGTRTADSLIEDLQRGLNENSRMRKAAQSDDTICSEVLKGFILQEEVLHIPMQYARSVEEFKNIVSGHSFYLPTQHCAQIAYEATGGCPALVANLHMHLRQQFVQHAYTNHGDNEEVSNSHYIKLMREEAAHSDPKANTPKKPTELSEAEKKRDEENSRLENEIRENVYWFWEEGAEIHCTQKGEDYLMRHIEWRKVAPTMCSRFLELYDVLSPRHQLLLRVVAAVSTTTGACHVHHAGGIMKKLNPRITDETTLADTKILKELNILRDEISTGDEGEVMFASPAMLDVVSALLTPEQDKTLKRFAFKAVLGFLDSMAEGKIENFITDAEYRPVFASFIARLAFAAGSIDEYKKHLRKSWEFTLAATEGPDRPFEKIRRRMEERLLTERRRNPEIVDSELFKGINGPLPLFKAFKSDAQVALEDAPLMPELMEYGRGFLPPMALGAISGELQKLAWSIINSWCEFTKRPHVKLLPEGMDAMLGVDIDEMIKAIAKFDQVVPRISPEQQQSIIDSENDEVLLVEGLQFEARFQRKPRQSCLIHDEFTPPTTIEDEKELLQRLAVVPTNKLGAFKQLALLRAYVLKVMIPRRDRLNHFVAHMESTNDMLSRCSLTKDGMTSKLIDEDPVLHAFNDLRDIGSAGFGGLVGTTTTTADSQSNDLTTTSSRGLEGAHRQVHIAIISLAVGGWKSKYFHINLQLIRDFVLRLNTASPVDFKAMLMCFKLLGDEITDSSKFMAAMQEHVAGQKSRPAPEESK